MSETAPRRSAHCYSSRCAKITAQCGGKERRADAGALGQMMTNKGPWSLFLQRDSRVEPRGPMRRNSGGDGGHTQEKQ